jgi:hypothetical protein
VVKIGAKIVSHGRYAILQMAEVAVPRELCSLESSTGSPCSGRRTLLGADANDSSIGQEPGPKVRPALA